MQDKAKTEEKAKKEEKQKKLAEPSVKKETKKPVKQNKKVKVGLLIFFLYKNELHSCINSGCTFQAQHSSMCKHNFNLLALKTLTCSQNG